MNDVIGCQHEGASRILFEYVSDRVALTGVIHN